MNYKKTIIALALFGAVGYTTNYLFKNSKTEWITLNNKTIVENRKSIEILEELKENNFEEKIIDEIIDVCYKKKRELNKDIVAKEGFQNPYQIEYTIKKFDKKAVGYLIDENSGIAYPIYEGMQLGSVEHRINGLKSVAEKKIKEGFEEVRKSLNDALDYVVDEMTKQIKE